VEDTSSYPEKALLALLAQGDRNAFREVFDSYRNKIYYFARKFIKSETEAEDILQEIFLKVWINRQKLSEIDNFKAYIYTLTRNHIYNVLRKQANREIFLYKLSCGMDGSGEPSKALDDIALHELQTALQRVTDTLTPQQKHIFELSRMEGLKQEEIAAQLGISINTVKKHMGDALRTIRSRMQAYDKLAQFAILLVLIRL
jgi:RNA polymerase sigma-70 factor (ECF subfamily)